MTQNKDKKVFKRFKSCVIITSNQSFTLAQFQGRWLKNQKFGCLASKHKACFLFSNLLYVSSLPQKTPICQNKTRKKS